jgi:hypothetical protein
MPEKPQTISNHFSELSGNARSKALFSEQRARVTNDPIARKAWEELAMQWHLMANLAEKAGLACADAPLSA